MARRYTKQERAWALAALAANNHDVPFTCQQLGIPDSTLRDWQKAEQETRQSQPSRPPRPTQSAEPGESGENHRDRDKSREMPDTGDVFEDLHLILKDHAKTLADELLDADHAAPLNQRSSALGVVIDRLLKLDDRSRALSGDAGAAPPTEQGPPKIYIKQADGSVVEKGERWGRDDDGD